MQEGAINFSAASAADIAGAGGSAAAAAAYLQPLVAAATAAGTASTTGAAESGGGGLFLPGPAAAGIGPDGLPCQPDLPGPVPAGAPSSAKKLAKGGGVGGQQQLQASGKGKKGQQQ